MRKVIFFLILQLVFSSACAATKQERIAKQNEILKQLAFEGHANAQDRYLSRLLETYMANPSMDTYEIQYFLEWATLRGKPNAAYRLGYFYITRPHLSNEQGIKYIARAAFLGNEKAMADYRLLHGLLDLPASVYVDAFNSVYRQLATKTPLECVGWLVNCDTVIQKVNFTDNAFFADFAYRHANSLSDIQHMLYDYKKDELFKFAYSESRFADIVREINQRKLANPLFDKKKPTNYDEQTAQQKKNEFDRVSKKLTTVETTQTLDVERDEIQRLLNKVNSYRLPEQQLTYQELIDMLLKEGQ